MKKASFKFYRQAEAMDCGPTCLRMIAKHYGKNVSLQRLRELSETTREGASLKSIADSAEKIGFRSLGVKISYKILLEEAPLPCIVHWQQRHFVVVYKVNDKQVFVADPAQGLIKYEKTEFIHNWIAAGSSENTMEGIALLLEPTPKLNATEEEDEDLPKGFSFLYQYLFRYKSFLLQLAIGLLIASILQLVFPFLTQSVVDIGIQNQDMNFIYLVLIAQLFLFIGKTSIEIIRSWILLHLSTRISISLVSDFFIKLMKLPISYFDVKLTGDIMQRINDHQKVESFLTSGSLSVLFSLFNLLIFAAVLWWYDWRIFLIFLIGSTIYVIWILLFLKKRKILDYKRFSQLSEEQSKIVEIISGMQDIKLNNAEKQKRWSWELLQTKLFKISIKNLSLQQKQIVGSNFINEVKNILISFYSAKLVIEGDISLGMMMAVTYIIGQLNSPIQQLISFVYALQDASIALERMSEIHHMKDEEDQSTIKDAHLSAEASIELRNVSFRYTGSSRTVLKKLNLSIPANKITAIVGVSGSGKTTLLKLLLKFYEPTKGELMVGKQPLKNYSQQYWRSQCGVVMQEGYIFNDTIANNIAVGADFIDSSKLEQAVEISNIKEYIESLPLRYNTKVGVEGIGMSAGQKQRLLIARAIYKDPKLIFFDEATSALDAKNERMIINKLDGYFENKTAVVVAHRLSTVKKADQIVVLQNGNIIEKGKHEELVLKKGSYYHLVKDQLELGN